MKFQLIIDPAAEEQVIVTAHRPSDLTAKLEALVRGGIKDRLTAFGEDETVFLSTDQIECITVINGKTCAIDSLGKQYRLNKRLYELEQELPSCFIRINKSTLANETRIERFQAAFSGAVDVVFQSGYREYVSRRCLTQLKRRFSL